MKTIEERIWDYVSGLASEKEKQALEAQISYQTEYRKLFDQIQKLHKAMSSMEPEEPSMAFQKNVMRTIEALPNPVHFPKVDQRIIQGIATLFIISILSILGIILLETNWSAAVVPIELPKWNWNFSINKNLLLAFLFVDVILALFLLDELLRKRLSI